jgi:hypothetical protein
VVSRVNICEAGSGRVIAEFWLEFVPRKRKDEERVELNSMYLHFRTRIRIVESAFMRNYSRPKSTSNPPSLSLSSWFR